MSHFITVLLQICSVKLVRSNDLCRSVAEGPGLRVTGRGSSPGWRRLLLNIMTIKLQKLDKEQSDFFCFDGYFIFYTRQKFVELLQ